MTMLNPAISPNLTSVIIRKSENRFLFHHSKQILGDIQAISNVDLQKNFSILNNSNNRKGELSRENESIEFIGKNCSSSSGEN